MAPLSDYDFASALQTAEFLRSSLDIVPVAAVFTGTGLGSLAASLRQSGAIQYADIPNFPTPTVVSHRGRLLAGDMGGKPVYVFQGRFHLYEGYSPRAVTFPVRVLQALGLRTLVLTNASGGLNPGYAAGDIMVVEDHINLTGATPLAGPNDNRWGVRFPEMINAYDATLRQLAASYGAATGVPIQTGVYAGLKGPSLETPAEMRYLRTMGADAVGFSTVMETIAGVHAGMQVLSLSVITNVCDPQDPAPADVQSIIETAERAAPQMGATISKVLEAI